MTQRDSLFRLIVASAPLLFGVLWGEMYYQHLLHYGLTTSATIHAGALALALAVLFVLFVGFIARRLSRSRWLERTSLLAGIVTGGGVLIGVLYYDVRRATGAPVLLLCDWDCSTWTNGLNFIPHVIVASAVASAAAPLIGAAARKLLTRRDNQWGTA
jgi:hypothetical protein